MAEKKFRIIGEARTEGAARGIETVDDAMAQARASADRLAKGFDETGARSERFGKVLKGSGVAVATMATAIAAATATAAAFASEWSAAADEVAKTAKKLDVPVMQLQRLRFAAERSGVSADSLTGALKDMNKLLAEARANEDHPFAKVADAIGLSLERLAAMQPEQRLGAIADALTNVSDANLRARAALAFFGEEAGMHLAPLLMEGSRGIQALGDEAQRLGKVFDEGAAAAAERLQDQLTNMRARASSVSVELATVLVPAASDVLEKFGDWVDKNDDLIKQDLPTLMHSTAEATMKVGEAIGDVVDMFRELDRVRSSLADIDDAGDIAILRMLGYSTEDAAAIAGVELRSAKGMGDSMLLGGQVANARGRIAASGLGAMQPREDRSDAVRGALGTSSSGGSKDKGEDEFEKWLRKEEEHVRAILDYQERVREMHVQLSDEVSRGFERQMAGIQELEDFRLETVLNGRLRELEELEALGADPILMLTLEEEARTQAFEAQLERSDSLIERAQLQEQIEQTHHAARLQRLKIEQQADKARFAAKKAIADSSIGLTMQVAEVGVMAAITEGQSVKKALQDFAGAASIRLTIQSIMEAIQAIIAAARYDAAGAALHGAASIAAGVQASVVGTLAGGLALAGGGGGGGGGGGQFFGGAGVPAPPSPGPGAIDAGPGPLESGPVSRREQDMVSRTVDAQSSGNNPPQKVEVELVAPEEETFGFKLRQVIRKSERTTDV